MSVVPPVKNEKGQYILYDKGVAVGATDIDIIDGCIVPVGLAPTIYRMKKDAASDGVLLSAAVVIRIIAKQIQSRRNNLIITPKLAQYRESDPIQFAKMVDELVMDGPPKLFKPETGKPGYSKHQAGTAIDWNVTKIEGGVKVGMLPSYKWLIDNAWKYGMVRTILSEPWHFEINRVSGPLTAASTYYFVPKGHPSWDLNQK